MQVHVFENSSSVSGFTLEATGSNLPKQESNWKFVKTIEVQPGQPLIAVKTDDLIKGLESHGYYLNKVEIKVTITGA